MADTPKKLRPADVCDLRRDTVRICDPLFNDYGARVVFQGTIVTIGTFEDNTKVREVLASDGAGKVLANQETGALEQGSVHAPEKVSEFLGKWAAKPIDAEQLYKDALARAEREQKRILVHLGAPW